MNIFYLDHDPITCAQYHVDRHCVKMIVEYAQLLSTAHRYINGILQESQYTPIKFVDGVLIAGKVKIKKDYTLLHISGKMDKIYALTHHNHPSAVWVRKSAENYKWLYNLFVALLDEYTYRYGKIHKTASLVDVLRLVPEGIGDEGFTPPTPAMDKEYQYSNVMYSYHYFYNMTKNHIFSWKHRSVPYFIDSRLAE